MVLVANALSSIFWLALLLVVMTVSLRWSKRTMRASAERIKKLGGRLPEERSLGHNLDAPPEMVRSEIQMHDMARDLFGQLDSKIVIVTQLLSRAEEQLVLLQRAMERAEQLGIAPGETFSTLESSTTGQPLVEPPHPPLIQEGPCSEIYELADEGYSSSAIATRLGAPVGEVELILSLRGNASR